MLLAESSSSINQVLITSASTVIVALIGTLGASFRKKDPHEDAELRVDPVPAELAKSSPDASQWLELVLDRDKEIKRLMNIMAQQGVDPVTGLRVRRGDDS
jgi:hypothetical protein